MVLLFHSLLNYPEEKKFGLENVYFHPGCYYGFGVREEKKWKCFKNDRIDLGTKTGRYTKPNIDLQKKFLKNLKRCAWAGGGVRVSLHYLWNRRFFARISLILNCFAIRIFFPQLEMKENICPVILWYMIWNCTLRKNYWALRLFVQNAEKNAQCHFSRAGSNGTGWNFRILGYTTSALRWAHNELCLRARAWFTKYAHHIILCLSNTPFQCGVGSRRQNSLLEMSIPDVSRRAWFTKDALHMPKTYKCLVYSLHLPTTY